MVRLNQALERAFAKGATLGDIEAEAAFIRRNSSRQTRRNTIVALQMHSWNNTKAEAARLAAAIMVERELRK